MKSMKLIHNCEIVVTGSGVRLSLMVVQPLVDLCIMPWWIMYMEHFWIGDWQWETEVLTEKLASLPFCPPQISRGVWVMDCV
jgi:hypothetical protein